MAYYGPSLVSGPFFSLQPALVDGRELITQSYWTNLKIDKYTDLFLHRLAKIGVRMGEEVFLRVVRFDLNFTIGLKFSRVQYI